MSYRTRRMGGCYGTRGMGVSYKTRRMGGMSYKTSGIG